MDIANVEESPFSTRTYDNVRTLSTHLWRMLGQSELTRRFGGAAALNVVVNMPGKCDLVLTQELRRRRLADMGIFLGHGMIFAQADPWAAEFNVSAQSIHINKAQLQHAPLRESNFFGVLCLLAIARCGLGR